MKKGKKIYGIYPGYIKNTQDIEEMGPSELFLYISYLSRYINNTMEFVNENVENVDLSEEEYTLDYLIYQTTKFGIDIPEPEFGKRIEITDSFMDWYKIYYKYFKSIMSEEEYRTLENNVLDNICLKIPKRTRKQKNSH